MAHQADMDTTPKNTQDGVLLQSWHQNSYSDCYEMFLSRINVSIFSTSSGVSTP